MPELPEVETVVRTLGPAILGRRIEALRLLRPDFARPAGFDWSGLAGRRITSLTRRAKRILFGLDDGRRFYAHLGMTGRLTLGAIGRTPDKHTHVIAGLGETELHFTDARRFGRLVWLGSEAGEEDIGPEPLTLRPQQLARRLAATRRPVKTALLDQRLIAGLGNIYVDEALFHAGIHPLRRCNRLSPEEVRRLNRAIKAVLRQALRHRGSTLRDYVDAEGRTGDFRRLHRVYDREGEPCPRCGRPIARIVLGGRSTHFCATCQGDGMKMRPRR